ncbi:hypothetical protein HYC85_027665 [Camellia sinensis]|uniref:Uncharacterized protein n=1 Tax=Camellia sinensis TaxID=4442 RepID=A0A7J7FX29_CAMSI|nr:hypothetical protein HYC85_027665 [Camellia sinensis]
MELRLTVALLDRSLIPELAEVMMLLEELCRKGETCKRIEVKVLIWSELPVARDNGDFLEKDVDNLSPHSMKATIGKGMEPTVGMMESSSPANLRVRSEPRTETRRNSGLPENVWPMWGLPKSDDDSKSNETITGLGHIEPTNDDLSNEGQASLANVLNGRNDIGSITSGCRVLAIKERYHNGSKVKTGVTKEKASEMAQSTQEKAAAAAQATKEKAAEMAEKTREQAVSMAQGAKETALGKKDDPKKTTTTPKDC